MNIRVPLKYHSSTPATKFDVWTIVRFLLCLSNDLTLLNLRFYFFFISLILDVPAVMEHPGTGRFGRRMFSCSLESIREKAGVWQYRLSLSLSPSRTKPQHRSSCGLAGADGDPGLCRALLLDLQAEQWLLPETHRVWGPLLPYAQLQHSTVRRKRPRLWSREE